MVKISDLLLTRRSLVAIAAAGCAAAIPGQAKASIPTADYPSDRFVYSFDADGTVEVLDVLTGENGRSVVDYNARTACIQYSNGTVVDVTVDGSGFGYANGELVLSCSQIPCEMMRSVPSGYVPLVTNRYTLEASKNMQDVNNAIISLIVSLGAGFLLGSAASTIAGFLVELAKAGQKEGYLEIKQYYHPNTYYIYTVVTLYKNSNYTGVLWRSEYGPNPPV